jgi:GntR family transcriptional regulator
LKNKYGLTATGGVENISVREVNSTEAELLHIAPETPAFFIQGVTDDQNGRHVEYFKSLTRADKVRFISTLRNKNSDIASEVIQLDGAW